MKQNSITGLNKTDYPEKVVVLPKDKLSKYQKELIRAVCRVGSGDIEKIAVGLLELKFCTPATALDVAVESGIMSDGIAKGVRLMMFTESERKRLLDIIRKRQEEKSTDSGDDEMSSKKRAEDQNNALVSLYAEGHTYKEIGEKLGLSETTVQKRAAELRKAGRINSKYFVWDEEKCGELVKLIDSGVSVKDAAKRFGITESAVKNKYSRLTAGKEGKDGEEENKDIEKKTSVVAESQTQGKDVQQVEKVGKEKVQEIKENIAIFKNGDASGETIGEKPVAGPISPFLIGGNGKLIAGADNMVVNFTVSDDEQSSHEEQIVGIKLRVADSLAVYLDKLINADVPSAEMISETLTAVREILDEVV